MGENKMAKTKGNVEQLTNFSAIVEVDTKGQNQELYSHLLEMVLLASENDQQFKEDLLEQLNK